ncbi:disintegrin and metalloproteinase domain-containing protein 26A-like [Mesocricetus auratus]|uniref:Disintegrin and metalloproteinase domain-containing protein 26A-like n=1 Tax=Mesocricetus auratus TaxID=10036 RepID=A0ABM2WAD9_MESAU|nr:disintegrin and metalloproteinase domain-containing protein 26A-like [Mesocricetus auratus]XP_040587909.1 disintegrin and metalloproteinase domain-containing protein 26A-like [Mesocricetus auratus]XP_040587910.1 disintegrin and metalloproteinase domain-containing protein 26A-like [Mesocricetus auratus]
MVLQLCLWIVLFLSTWAPTTHAEYSSPPEVVIPLRVTDTRIHSSSPDWLSYSLRFGGERHIITMKPTKYFISRNFLLLTYTDQGDLLAEQPFVQTDCYYQGNVDGDPDSMVIINTCLGGLQGMLEINGTVYEIMPQKSTSTFEHLAYKIESEDSESFSMRCALTEEEIARQKKIQESKDPILMQSQYENWWTHHKYLEYFVVIDNKRYVYRNNNITTCIHDILQIVNGINGYYLQIDIEVILTTLQVWSEQNHINVEENIYSVLNSFCSWKQRNIGNQIRYDIIHLFPRQGYGIYLGLAHLGTLCSRYNCAVNSFASDSIAELAFVLAHEMGHNLGMHHDDRDCTCGISSCIMAAHKSNSHRFSNCSYAYLYDTITRKTCLHNFPEEVVGSNLTWCGNNIVEEGEQCDCGSPQLCENDPCCRPDCAFKPGAECAFGLCCKDCKLIPTGTVCRKQNNECDLPEWCNGTSAKCPEDVYVEDGHLCSGSGYCYKSVCHKHEKHCQTIFGKGAKSANEICYMELNKRGDRFGNCGNNSYNYIQCNSNDVLCGRIQCENITELPHTGKHETVHWTHIKNVTCWTVDYHFGITKADIGAVKDGTPCGLDHLCIDRKCVNNSFLLSNCSATHCHKRGVCNNKHHCHCDVRWEPPDCRVRGFGGSIDSGPPPGRFSKSTRGKYLAFFLILFVVLLLCLSGLMKRIQYSLN